YFDDSTGDYDASTNPGGYGTPNPTKASITSTSLQMIAPGSDDVAVLTPWTYLPTDANPATITCDMYVPIEEETCDYAINIGSPAYPLANFTVIKNGESTNIGSMLNQAAVSAYFVSQGFTDAYPAFSKLQTEDVWTSVAWTGQSAITFTPDNCVDDDPTTDGCADCPDDILETDCDDEETTCFVDGCWTFIYTVFTGSTVIATTTFTQFFYGQTLKRLEDLFSLYYSNQLPNVEDINWQLQLNILKNDFDNALVNASVNDCDCLCMTNILASIQKRLTEYENKI